MKLSDFIAQFLADEKVKYVFGVTGGAVVHVFDSIDRLGKTTPIFTHHEQAAAFAAVAYARVVNDLGAAIVTTGPGGTNAITGLCAAWLDSIPCLFFSGQARVAHTTRGKPIRQLGSQQIDIIPIVSSMTKYTVMIDDPKMIKYHLQKAVYTARVGRPGPVWIDLPLDIQWAPIDPEQLPAFNPSELDENLPKDDLIERQVEECLKFLTQAQRPIILVGYGVRLAHAEQEIKELIERLQVPFLSSWNTSDILPTDHQLYVGRPGIFGQRGANLSLQNCDLLLSIGSHFSIPLTGTNFPAFAREAKRIMVDIDPVEHQHRTVRIDLSIQCDAKLFLKKMLQRKEKFSLGNIEKWREKCLHYKEYNVIPSQWRSQKRYIHPYDFVDVLSEELNHDEVIVVDGGGTIAQIAFQAFRVKEGQRLMIDTGITAMGSGLPESIGACFANRLKPTICLCGDGGMQFNIQELQTIVHHQLPIKIFFLNNDGYLSIRHTQEGFLDSNFVGSTAQGGLSLPDFRKVAKAYGIKSMRISHHRELTTKIQRVLGMPGPVVCEVMVDPKQDVQPRQGFERTSEGLFRARPLEDMYPFLDRKEFFENMIVAPWDGSR